MTEFVYGTCTVTSTKNGVRVDVEASPDDPEHTDYYDPGGYVVTLDRDGACALARELAEAINETWGHGAEPDAVKLMASGLYGKMGQGRKP